MPPEAVLALRQKIQQTFMGRQFRDENDPLAMKRQQTVRELYEVYFAEFQLTRGERRSPRTLETYREMWDLHLLPAEVEIAGTQRALEKVRIDQVTVTGARMQEVLQATLSRAAAQGTLLPYLERTPYPRIVVQRAKGDRGSMKRPAGRSIWLPSVALTMIDRIDRPLDAADWMLPGEVPGQPIQRLNKA